MVSEENLWMLEDNFEQSFAQIINRDGVNNVYASRQGLQMEVPCVEIAFNVGQVTEKRRHAFPDTTRKPCYSGWVGSTVEFTVKTNRSADVISAQHKVMLSKIRKNCQMFHLLVTWPDTIGSQANTIADIREVGSKYSVDSDNNLDVTVITFWLMHNLIDSAFPSDI
jgi:hypothetical protein